jgi:hypothetical protein
VALTDEQIAQVCHEANRALCLVLGDTSQPQWDEAPEWQKKSAIDGVAFKKTNPNAPDDASHKEWMRAKQAVGWEYGPIKDAEKKQHPCMVPFEELPPEQQIKDAMFGDIVSVLTRVLAEYEKHHEFGLLRKKYRESKAGELLAIPKELVGRIREMGGDLVLS